MGVLNVLTSTLGISNNRLNITMFMFLYKLLSPSSSFTNIIIVLIMAIFILVHKITNTMISGTPILQEDINGIKTISSHVSTIFVIQGLFNSTIVQNITSKLKILITT